MSGVKLAALNAMDRESFARTLGPVFEHSPWIAERGWASRPFGSLEELHEALLRVVRESGDEAVDAFLRAHPDLGTRLAVTTDSAAEQSGAGLDRLTPEEYDKLFALNREYAARYGFPFILAVRGRTKEDVIAAMEARIGRSVREEREEALEQIRRITGFRLRDRIEP